MNILDACEFVRRITHIAVCEYKAEDICKKDWAIIHKTLHYASRVRERLILEREFPELN